jgi:cobalt-zinc-cadmium efflux system outer membrane protein
MFAAARLLAWQVVSPADRRLEPLPSPTTFSIADLEQMALESNPTLAQAFAAVEAARGRALQASRLPNPRIGYQGSEIGNEGTAGQNGILVSQQFVRRQKLNWRVNVEEAAALRAEQVFASQQQRVLNDIRQLFYETLYAQKYLELAQQMVTLGEKSVRIAETRLMGLETGRADVLLARVETSRARLLFADAEYRLASVWRRLAAVVGVHDLPPRMLEGDLAAELADLEWNETRHQLQTESPEIATAAAAVERAHAVVHREIAEVQRDFQVQAGVQYDDSTGDTFFSTQIMTPLLFHDRRQGAIRAARSELTAAEHELRRVELELTQRLAVAFQRYSSARRQFQVYEDEMIPNAQESLELVRHGYEAGEYNYATLLTAQRTFVRASLDRLEALRELRSTTVSIRGMLLDGALQDPRR